MEKWGFTVLKERICSQTSGSNFFPFRVVPILRNINSNIRGRSSNVIKVVFHSIYGTALKERICSQTSGSKFLPLRVVPILKWDTIEENHCLIR